MIIRLVLSFGVIVPDKTLDHPPVPLVVPVNGVTQTVWMTLPLVALAAGTLPLPRTDASKGCGVNLKNSSECAATVKVKLPLNIPTFVCPHTESTAQGTFAGSRHPA